MSEGWGEMAANAATGTVTLLFTDLVGSTEALQRLGEEGGEQFRRTHFRLLREAVAAHNGQEVKNLGDGLMVAFGSALDATRCAIAMQQAVERHNRRGGEPLSVRVGLHVGEPIRDEEDYFGIPVVIAQRLCASAGGGQVVASELVQALVGGRGGLSFRSLGPRSLKGVSEPVSACEVLWEPAVATRSSLPRLGLGTWSPFIGRDREVALMQAMLEETARGSGRLALIAGEPGIGKTRLLADVAERAAAQGWLVLFGRAYESEGMPPYRPFVEALGQYVKGGPPGDLRMQLGRGAAEVALLVPELLERVPGIEPSPPLSQDERYRLFEGVTGFLLNIARAGGPGLLLGLEDLHWADEASLRLLEHVGRRLTEAPLLVMATCRTADADRSQTFTAVVTGLQRERLCEQVDVVPFSEQEAVRLVEQLAGSTPTRAVVEAVYHETGGNPFFLEEVVRHLQSEGRDLAGEHAVTGVVIPESVRQVIGVRLMRLRPESVRALQVAAALGDPFSFDTLAAATGANLAPLLDALDEAAACGFVREEGDGDYHFSHALVRETVYAGLSAPRRALLHAQVAENLEALYQANASVHAGELAHHFLLGGRRGDLGKAMGYALQAAERATVQTAFEEAVRYYQVAIDANERSEEQDEARRCEMLLALATATLKAGDWDGSEELNLTAAEAARAAGLPELLVRACLATAVILPRPIARLIPLIEDALAAIPGDDSPSRSRLLSLLAYQRSWAGTSDGRSSMHEESIAMARRLGDARSLGFALCNAFLENASYRLSRQPRGPEILEEVIQLARELGDKELEVSSQCLHLSGSLVLGDIAAVDAGIEEHARLGDELQQRIQMGHPFLLRSMRALLSGPLSRAEQLDDEWERASRRYSVGWLAAVALPFRLVLCWEQGRLAELQPVYRAALERRATPLVQACLAFTCSELDDAAEAQALVEQLGRDQFVAVPFDLDWSFALSLLSHACFVARDTQHAEALYGLLLPRARYAVTVQGASVCLGSTSRYLGMLATTLGRFANAERHFDDSDAMNTRLGARPLLAHTKVDRARMHLARHAQGDIARARELLEEAAAAFDGLEIPYHAGKARELLESLPQGAPAARLPWPPEDRV
jgi:class 3 adenylate cyclase/tetratricopeptide (TPR) repeat protein